MDLFTFELMVTFVESLSLAHKDDKSLGKYFTYFSLIYNPGQEH